MITMLYGGLCVLLVIFLAVRVAAWRLRHKIGLGDGGDRELLKRMRAHANAIENMPLALLLLGGMELNGFSTNLIHGFGATLLVSRVAHAWGVSHSSGSSKGRMVGIVFTWLLMAAMAVVVIVGYFQQFSVA
ncbi:MAPEG family protein [Arenimonas oryziterrae]|uniref:Glutathione S-transferase n=1 Tax=Arenimonas oryziterrae DSM 21050 = YC6267 TaxID=1121015 RepID=A0A091B074_9GAMM|nr:MAPEG family protein [Arenimonas oryziterrae]KFN44932.1 hypothetical protein N789_02615 [Arenimonas oryziterrae DSM 21050 = YC6267]